MNTINKVYTDIHGSEVKLCSECCIIKSVSNFKTRKYHYGRRYTSACKECYSKYRKTYQDKIGNDYEYRRKLKTRYNITPEEYTLLLNKQDNKCAICKRDQKLFKRRLHIDHNHKTGKVRGLLCVSCNNGIGNFKEEKESMLKAIRYLEKYNECK